LISDVEEFSAENILSFDNYCEQLYFNADDMNFILDASPKPVLTKFIWTPELVSSHICQYKDIPDWSVTVGRPEDR
jgi:hypothetical protein